MEKYNLYNRQHNYRCLRKDNIPLIYRPKLWVGGSRIHSNKKKILYKGIYIPYTLLWCFNNCDVLVSMLIPHQRGVAIAGRTILL